MRILFWLFYTASIVTWFKDSFAQLSFIPIGFGWPLIGLIVISLVRLITYFKKKSPFIKIELNKSTIFLVFLIILAIAIRIPYLANHSGLSDSDDGLTMLMSKHIADGKRPPLYFYKQYYQGSLFSHFSALFIALFGYSHLLMEIIVLLFYCAFIVVQFNFLKKIFSFPFALISSVFYCLPIGHLIRCSFFVSSAYPLVLLLGSIILFLTYHIVYNDRKSLLPALGFLMGLAFWTHQISISFILAALILLITKIRTLWKKYLSAFFYVVMGALPLIMGEIFWNFHLIRYLMPVKGISIGGGNITKSLERSLTIFSQTADWLSYVFFLLLLLGLIALFYPSLKAKKFQPQSIFSVFFLLFTSIYLLSRFGEKNVIRYFYILYFCLPVLFFGLYWFIRPRIKYYLMCLTLLLMLVGMNIKGSQKYLQTVKNAHQQRTQAVHAMKATGQRYWRANFWAAYLLTAISGEAVIVDSYSVNRYFPYRLMYESEAKNENFLFIMEGRNSEERLAWRFPKLLAACRLDFKEKKMDGYSLVYGIPQSISPAALMAHVPNGFPDVKISSISFEKGFLDLVYTSIGQRIGTDYWIHAEIPGFSSLTKRFPVAKGRMAMKLPYPKKDTFPLEFHLIYKGVKIMSSHKKIICSPPKDNAERNKKLVFLSGIGPKVIIEGRKMYTCSQQANIEINGEVRHFSRLRLIFYSPFEFSDPAWYGDYVQKVDIIVNGEVIQEIDMSDGINVISIPIEGLPLKDKQNNLFLQFRHRLFFNFAPFGKTAALLEKIELER